MHRLLKINIQGSHDRAIDLQAKSRCTGDELGIEGGKLSTGSALSDELLGEAIELTKGIGPIAEVVELEIEATLGREARNGWGLGSHRQASTQLFKLGVEPPHNGWGLVLRARALLEGFQAKEKQTLVWAGTVKS